MAAAVMQATSLPQLVAQTPIFMLDFITSGAHGQNGDRDVDTAACRRGACSRVRSDRQKRAGASLSDSQLNPGLGRDHRGQCGVPVAPVNVAEQVHAFLDNEPYEPQRFFYPVRVNYALANPPFSTMPDHALGVVVAGTAVAEHDGPAKIVQQHMQNMTRIVRTEQGSKLLEVAKQDILPGGATTQRHIGGQQRY